MNPEFQRNLWLEASPRRVAWVAVTVALIYFAAMMVTRDMPRPDTIIAGFGLAVFVACAVLWAARAAGSSILTEVAERTWDFQRLSALTAWSMTWGKLLGATLLASTAGLTGIAVYLFFAEPTAKPWLVILLLGAALLVQTLSFMATLIGVRKARAEGRPARTGGVLGGLILGYFLLSGLAATKPFNIAGSTNLLGWMSRQGELVGWWNMRWDGEPFWAVTVLVFAAFALAGAWRLMRLELQMRSEPIVWPIFLAFLAIWVAGFREDQQGHWAGVTSASMAMCLAAYVAAFVEPADRVALRRFGRLAVQGQATEAARTAPAAVLPLAMAIILALLAIGLRAGPRGAGEAQTAGVALAFLVRDLGVITLFRFGPRPQRGDFGAILALIVLYGVGGIVGTTIGRDAGAALFLPKGPDHAVLGMASALIQAAVAWTLAARRIRSPETSVSAPPSGPASVPA